ncbi:MAG TPA: PQQ-binding-like beta-propeller repeat protein [Phycisphaerae bacterium]|nr:PQQ-binding-like beta-propeller repeat protein [Phycisphaerae bacterium]
MCSRKLGRGDSWRTWGVWMVALLAGAGILAIASVPSSAGEDAKSTTPEESDADLVRKLGSESWRTREEAQKELIRRGEPAVDELTKAMDSDDPEVRQRAEATLKAIRKEARESKDKAILESVLWKSSVKEGVASAPAVSKGVVCFMGSDGSLRAVDAKTGKAKWSFQDKEAAKEQARAPGPQVVTGGAQGPAPLIADGTVYVSARAGHIYAVDLATGRLKWKSASADGFGPPAIAGGVLYVGGTDGGVYALDAATGKQSWRGELPNGAAVAPVVVGKTVYVADKDKNVHALAAATGQKRTLASGLTAAVVGMVAVGDEMLVVRTTDGLTALDLRTGQSKWSHPLPTHQPLQAMNVRFQVAGGQINAADIAAQYDGAGRPVLQAGVLYAAGTNEIHAIDAASGKQLWSYKPKPKAGQAQAQVRQVFVGNAGVVVIGGQGRVIMQGVGTRLISPPCIDGGMMYVGSSYGLHAVELKTRQELWRLETTQPVQLCPTAADGTLYFAAGSGLQNMAIAAGARPAQQQPPTELSAVKLLAPAAKAADNPRPTGPKAD